MTVPVMEAMLKTFFSLTLLKNLKILFSVVDVCC